MICKSALAAFVFLVASPLVAQSPAPNAAQNPALNPWQTPAQPARRAFRYEFASPSGSSPSQVFSILNPTGPSCPVTMRAEHRSAGSVMTAGTGQGAGQVTGIAQRIHLVFGETGVPSRVTAATVTVRGTNGQWRVMTASTRQSQQGSPYLSRTLNAIFVADGEGTESTELELPGFTSVKSIRLDSIQYADGSIWTPADGRSCRVEPDPFMLVSSR